MGAIVKFCLSIRKKKFYGTDNTVLAWKKISMALMIQFRPEFFFQWHSWEVINQVEKVIFYWYGPWNTHLDFYKMTFLMALKTQLRNAILIWNFFLGKNCQTVIMVCVGLHSRIFNYPLRFVLPYYLYHYLLVLNVLSNTIATSMQCLR